MLRWLLAMALLLLELALWIVLTGAFVSLTGIKTIGGASIFAFVFAAFGFYSFWRYICT